MNPRKDYGLHLLESGFDHQLQVNLYPFKMFALCILDNGGFSATSVMPIDGVDFAITIDLDRQQLEEIIALAPQACRHEILLAFERDDLTPRVVQLPGPVPFGVTATIGGPVQGPLERFAPLNACSIFPCE